MKISNTDFGKQVGLGTIGRILSAVISFGGSIIIARLLGPELYGTYFFLLSIASFLDNAVSGWSIGARKRYTETDSNQDEVIGSMIIFAAAGTVIAFFIGQSLTTLGIVSKFFLIGFLFTGTAAVIVFNNIILSTSRFGWLPWLTTVGDISRVVIQVLLVILGWGVVGMSVGLVVANLILIPIALYVVDDLPTLPSEKTVRSVWSFARVSIPRSFVGYGEGRLKTLFVAVLASTVIVGKFKITLNILLPAFFISQAISGGLLGRISDSQSRGEESSSIVESSIGFSSLFAIPVCAGGFIIGDKLVTVIYGSDYAVSVWFVGLLGMWAIFKTQARTMDSVLNGLDLPRYNLYISTLNVITMVTFGFALYQLVGSIGIIGGIVIGEFISYLGRAYVIRDVVHGAAIIPGILRKQVFSGCVMAGTLIIFREILILGSMWSVVSSIILGGTVYAGVLWAVSPLLRDILSDHI